jgi:NADPH-dependent ferric siderophore reductase
MNHVTRTPLRVHHRPQRRLAQVASVEAISPRMRRIVLAGEELVGFTSAAADDHVKLFFPEPGAEKPMMPVPAEAGGTSDPHAPKPTMRDFTPRRFDAERGEMTLEFVLHGDGPATIWASQAAAGQWLGVGGPRGSLLVPDDYDTYLMAGDETALPAIARFLEEARAGARVIALIEVADGREERHLPSAANASITWLHRDGMEAGRPELLLSALQQVTLPAGDTHAWVAAEIETARALRQYLVNDEGLPREQIRAAGYWRHGAVGAHTRLED